MAKTTIDGVTAEFANGGWYNGRQYWDGKLGAPGVIINPNQQGSGSAVSTEVVKQTNPNNATFLNTQQVQQHLNGIQNTVYGNNGDVPKVQSAGEIAADLKGSGLLPTGEAPKAPSLVDQLQKLSEERGVGRIQADITDLKAQQDAIAAQLRTNTAAEQGKPVAQNVIEGRISEQQRTAQEQYDFVGRQLARKVDEMNAANSSIQLIMQFTQTDYQNAATAYSAQFDRAINTINLIRGIQNDQKSERDKAIDNARANAQIYVNAITAGNLDLNSLPADQQAQLSTMEVQAGLPVGFFSALRKDPKADIVSTSESNGQIQVLMRNPDGSMSLQKYGTATSSTKQYGFAPPANGGSSNLAASIMDEVLGGTGTVYGPPSPKK